MLGPPSAGLRIVCDMQTAEQNANINLIQMPLIYEYAVLESIWTCHSSVEHTPSLLLRKTNKSSRNTTVLRTKNVLPGSEPLLCVSLVMASMARIYTVMNCQMM